MELLIRAKWYGKVGYVKTEETRPGVWGEKITEHEYSGDLLRNTKRSTASGNLNNNLNVANEISIVADPFAYENFHALRYVEFMGALWNIESAEVQYPRILLTMGGVYNGPKT